jgi:hypothetical protein
MTKEKMTQTTKTTKTKKSQLFFVTEGKTLKEELVIRGIKLIDIAYTTTIYLTLGAVLSIYTDQWLGKFDAKEADKQSTERITAEVLLHFSLMGMFFYIIRNLVEWIPFPFHNKFGYDHLKVKELSSGGVFATIFLLLQINLKDKILYLSRRIESNIFKKHNIYAIDM